MAERSDFYTIRFSAEPVQLVFFRYGLDRWLQGLGWPESARVDAILAVSEACTNSVEHAYPVGAPGEVEVVGRLVSGPESRHVVITVRDDGRWREGGDGLGLTTVRACMARVKIKHDASGTTVTMASVSVPLLPGVAEAATPAQRRSPEQVPRLRQV